MRIRFLLAICICASWFGIPVCAQPVPRVALLPFDIHAQEELTYLKAEIPAAIKQQLEKEGANVLVIADATVELWKSGVRELDSFRSEGSRLGAGHVIWGSLTLLGDSFSIDASLLATDGNQPPGTFSVQGSGIEELPGKVAELARQMSRNIFKRDLVADIQVEGNDRIEADAILRNVKTRVGDEVVLKNLSEDLKAIYSMGYFEDIRVATEAVEGGRRVIFQVEEKPTVRNIRISGNSWVYEDEEIEEVLTVRKGSILNVFTLRNDVRRIEELYKEKNYHNVNVDYKILKKKKNLADIEYTIEEGKKFHIEKIDFVGNQVYTDKQLRRQMATKEENFLSFITSAGDLNQEKLTQDTAKLASFYHNNGYIRARVGEPQVAFESEGIVITIKVDEGPRYKVGKVAFSGDLIVPREELRETIRIADEEHYNREVLRRDVLAITDLYSDEGYAYVNVSPLVDQDDEKLVANINFEIEKGSLVYFEEINITGNTKTRDKVIRRQLRVYEKELFSGKRLKRGVQNLYRLDFFEDVQINTSKGSTDDQINLDVAVKEKPTGAFSFGAGFGNVENLFGTASVSERNLFGRGQTLALKAQIGSKTQKFTLSFTEPWLFDIPLAAGADIYKWDYGFDDYDKDSIGGKLRGSYPVFDYTRAYLTYVYDVSRISNIEEDASDSIKELEGNNLKSSVIGKLAYDSRNNAFNATRGAIYGVSGEYAGLGGDVGFGKAEAEAGVYMPLFWKFTGVIHGKTGIIQDLEEKVLPDYEKFYMGGINSLRGFTRDDIAPKDRDGASIGGDKYVQLNLELKFPLVTEAGVSGLIFLDAGNIYTDREDIDITDFRVSAGPEIRWMSPVGPIRFAYGYILDPKDTDSNKGNWEFSMASAF
jgi:outer membrane protein insertion porin family